MTRVLIFRGGGVEDSGCLLQDSDRTHKFVKTMQFLLLIKPAGAYSNH